MLFEDFKRAYPNKWKKGTSYEPAGFMSIIVRIPEDGKYKYEYFGNKLTLIEKFLTHKQEKYLRKFDREEEMRNIFQLMKEEMEYNRRIWDIFEDNIAEYLKEQGVWICGTDMDTNTIYTKQDYKMPIAIVIGSEGFGMSRLVKEECDFIASIPMKGKINSLNASVATGIVVYEAVRQRK